MNRLMIIIILALVVPVILLAQINWFEHIICDDFDAAQYVYAIDLDSDGDVDVLGASWNNNNITWWENDGNENFTEHTIAGDVSGASSVYAINLDSDGDVDVLGTAFNTGVITWWENDGNENFTEHTIKDDFGGASSVFAIDLDDDDDIDILGAASSADDITWWENEGGSPPNFTEHTIANTFNGARSVYAIDLEPDGDIDVLAVAYFDDDITWWENDGNENFTEHTIKDDFDGAQSVYAIDLDDDNDIDVLGAAAIADDITWWENDGNENFTEHTIKGNFDGAWSAYALDLDDDTDIDILGAATSADDITWWENDGNENFTEHTIKEDFDGAHSVYAIDLDDDTDVDVLGTASTADAITWWENDLVSIDASTASIDIPSSLPPDTTLNPQATVTNLGSSSASFDVRCEIVPGPYTSTETVTNLAPDDSTQVTFSNLFTFIETLYTVTVYTQLADDENPANDTLVKLVGVNRIDVGPVSIDIPPILPESTTLNPYATAANYGSHTQSFPVTCTIEPGGYTKTQTIHDLTPGDTVPVTFFNEFTFASGTYIMTVYTRLGSDEYLANDTLEKVIETYVPGITEESSLIPKDFRFSASTISRGKAHIELALPKATEVDLLVYDVAGRLTETLVSKRLSAGTHNISVSFDLPAGVYFYNLKTTSGKNMVKKFLIVE